MAYASTPNRGNKKQAREVLKHPPADEQGYVPTRSYDGVPVDVWHDREIAHAVALERESIAGWATVMAERDGMVANSWQEFGATMAADANFALARAQAFSQIARDIRSGAHNDTHEAEEAGR